MPAIITGGLGIFSAGEAPPVDAIDPVVTVVSPAPGTPITAFTQIIIDVTDNQALLGIVVLKVSFAGRQEVEIIHDSKSFEPLYSESTRIEISNGYRYTIVRAGGWPSSPRITPIVSDKFGNEVD